MRSIPHVNKAHMKDYKETLIKEIILIKSFLAKLENNEENVMWNIALYKAPIEQHHFLHSDDIQRTFEA